MRRGILGDGVAVAGRGTGHLREAVHGGGVADLLPIGFRPIELELEWNADNNLIVWNPSHNTRQWLFDQLFQVPRSPRQPAPFRDRPLVGPLCDRWMGHRGQRDPKLHLNGEGNPVWTSTGRPSSSCRPTTR